MNFSRIRLKLIHWYKRNRNVVIIAFIVWVIIFIINKFLGSYTPTQMPNTTRTPQVSIVSSSSAPSKVQQTAEKMIEEYVGYCNEGNYKKAFNMLTEDCQKYCFFDDVEEFALYVLTKIPAPKKYSIQNYSNYGGFYIYEVKYIDDILATGLTNSSYDYSTEKIVFTKNSEGGYDMATGNFIKYDKINNISENNYVKIDIVDRVVRYSVETYKVKFTNRTDSTVVIQDNVENSEISLVLNDEYRSLLEVDEGIILQPEEQKEVSLSFRKFADDGENSVGILFSSIRVIEDYKGISGTEEERKVEIDNALAKFSLQVPVR